MSKPANGQSCWEIKPTYASGPPQCGQGGRWGIGNGLAATHKDRGELELFGDPQLAQSGPLSRAGAEVEKLETGVGDLEGVAFPLLVVLDEQQVASQIIFGGNLGRLVEPA